MKCYKCRKELNENEEHKELRVDIEIGYDEDGMIEDYYEDENPICDDCYIWFINAFEKARNDEIPLDSFEVTFY